MIKVNLPKNYKELFTIKEAENAKRIIKDLKTWDDTLEDFARYALNDINRNKAEWIEAIYFTSAEICADSATNDAYFEGSGHLDVWFDFVAETTKGFYKVGCLLSEAWAVGGDNHITRYNLRRFKEDK